MKKLQVIGIIFALSLPLSAQLRLNVVGDAKISGQLDLSSGGSNLFIGVDTGESNTTGTLNTFIGAAAGAFNSEGKSNVFVGPLSGFSNTTGEENVFIGQSSGQSNSEGNKNTFIGMDTGRANSVGVHNTFVGNATGESNTEGFNNTFIGHIAGNKNIDGANNTFIGDTNGALNTNGQDNTFLGAAAGFNNTSGDDNTFVGRFAGLVNTTGSNLTAFGSGSGVSLIGNGPINNSFAFGSNSLMLNSHSGVLGNISMQQIGGFVNWGTASDGRMKQQVREDVHGLDFILALRPVSYQVDAFKMDEFLRQGMEEVERGKEDQSTEEKTKARERQQTYERYLREKSTIRYTGFIAQEVERAMANTNFEFSGLVKPVHAKDHYSLRYAEFVVPLVKGMQEQQAVIEKQEQENIVQQRQMNELQATLRDQQQEIEGLKNLVQQLLAQQPGHNTVQKLDLKRQAALFQNHPNPFHESTLINYFLPEGSADARLEVYSVEGKLLTTLPLTESGEGRAEFKARRFPAGVYVYSLIVDNEVIESKRMVLTK